MAVRWYEALEVVVNALQKFFDVKYITDFYELNACDKQVLKIISLLFWGVVRCRYVTNYQATPQNIWEQQRFQVYRAENKTFRVVKIDIIVYD